MPGLKIQNSLILIGLLLMPAFAFSQQKVFLAVNVQPGIDSLVTIQWTADAAFDTLPFLVEKSTDKQNWEKLAITDPQNRHQYTVIDHQPGKGVIYYRVSQVNSNALKLFTQTRWVQINETGKLYIWPNPARHTLFIKAPYNNGIIDIVDSEGKRIYRIIMYNQVTELSVLRLPKGLYFIHVIHNNEELIERFIKD